MKSSCRTVGDTRVTTCCATKIRLNAFTALVPDIRILAAADDIGILFRDIFKDAPQVNAIYRLFYLVSGAKLKCGVLQSL